MPATTPTSSPALLPDPTDEAGVAVSPGSADDLIANLADQQIDDMMGEAAGEVHDADADAAIDAALDAASQLGDEAGALVASAAGELRAELDQMEADRSSAAPKVDAALLPEPAAIAPPSFGPAAGATIDAPPAEMEATAETVARAPTRPVEPIETPPPAVEVPQAQESSADAVARELAADVALLSTPLPAVVEHDAKEAERDPLWRKALAGVTSLPLLLLGAINLPARPLSDRGREIIGAAGIVTLVNAAGLLIYLTMFAHRH